MALFFIFYHMIKSDGQQKILEKHILGGNSPGFPSDFPANLTSGGWGWETTLKITGGTVNRLCETWDI